MNQPDIAIVHQPCTDGDACRWILEGKWPSLEIHPGVYGKEPPDVTDKGVLIADFSYPEETLIEMAAVAKWIHVLDHHAGAEDHLRRLAADNVIELTFDNERSGAGLTWDYCWGAGRQRPRLVEHVQDRDLWRFQIEGTREVHAVLTSYDYGFHLWTAISRRLEAPHTLEAVIEEGAAIIRARRRDLEAAIAASLRMMFIDGHEVPVVNVPYLMASEAGDALGRDFPNAPFSASYFDRGDGVRQVSLRSRGDFDVSKVAKKYGGGGHKAAAGFSLPGDGDAEFAGERHELKRGAK